MNTEQLEELVTQAKYHNDRVTPGPWIFTLNLDGTAAVLSEHSDKPIAQLTYGADAEAICWWETNTMKLVKAVEEAQNSRARANANAEFCQKKIAKHDEETGEIYNRHRQEIEKERQVGREYRAGLEVCEGRLKREKQRVLELKAEMYDLQKRITELEN